MASEELLTDDDKQIAVLRALLFELASDLGKSPVDSESPYSYCKRAIRELEAERDALAAQVAKLRGALSGLVEKIDEVAIDQDLGDETDRVFAHWEFGSAREALDATK